VKDAKLVGIITDDRLVDGLSEDDAEEPVTAVLDKTPFYGEMGGQVGDTGELVGQGFRFEVIDTAIDGALILHRGHLREGHMELGDAVTARVNARRRQGIRRAHSATHLLHYALRNVLGEHALQQGSKVDEDWFRFDFANPSAITQEELMKIEDEANERIWEGQPVRCTLMPLADARKAGAMMLFGEKYPDVVRMVAMGEFSKELCGGTHLENTGQVGLLKIIGEESVAAGTRRITAITGRKVLDYIHGIQTSMQRAALALRTSGEELPDRVETMAKELRDLRKKLAAGPKGGTGVDQLLADAAEVHGVKVVIAEVPGGTKESLRELIDQLRRKAPPVAVLLGTKQDESKVMLIAGFSRDLVDRGLDANVWVRKAAEVVGGKGGGRPDMAQAGGKHPDKLPEAFEAAKAEVEKLLAGA
jgi:alanyl-tRNA synthetase